MQNRKKKICFAASSGGHYEQLMMLKPIMEKYDSFIITENTMYDAEMKGEKTYFVRQVNRREKSFITNMLRNTVKSFICTGVLAMIPICVIAKLAGKKLIFIESFAKVTTGTLTGMFLYKYADQFYVQWESMLKVYPNAIYLGGIY